LRNPGTPAGRRVQTPYKYFLNHLDWGGGKKKKKTFGYPRLRGGDQMFHDLVRQNYG